MLCCRCGTGECLTSAGSRWVANLMAERLAEGISHGTQCAPEYVTFTSHSAWEYLHVVI